jgi:NADP-dependent aldehyde dehydrogenase
MRKWVLQILFLFFLKYSKLEVMIVEGLCGAICLGAGQFCTNPGMTVMLYSPESDKFISKEAGSLGNSPARTMVHSSIKTGYEKNLAPNSQQLMSL